MAGCIAHARNGHISTFALNLTSNRVPRNRFLLGRGDFGDSATNKSYIAHFVLCLRETAVFSLPV